MAINQNIQHYIKTQCKICANKDTNLCNIVVVKNITQCAYFVNEKLQNCMQRQCKNCNKAKQCFRGEEN